MKVTRSAGKPPIEPLSPRTWDEIEARVFEELDRDQVRASRSRFVPRQARAALAVAALALAASLVALIRVAAFEPALSTTPIGMTAGQADESRARSADDAPSANTDADSEATELTARHLVTLEVQSRAQLGDSWVTLAPHSEAQISGDDQTGWHINLEYGEVHCNVTKREARPDFIVRAGEVFVRVVGTEFDVVRRSERTRVHVNEGQVLVELDGRATPVSAGESWAEPTPPSVRRVSPPQRAAYDPTKSSARPRTAREEFERAAALESSNPTQALRIYQRLAQAGGTWAKNALYAQARLNLERGRNVTAKRLLREYLERYPRGPNAADARRLLSDGSTEPN